MLIKKKYIAFKSGFIRFNIGIEINWCVYLWDFIAIRANGYTIAFSFLCITLFFDSYKIYKYIENKINN